MVINQDILLNYTTNAQTGSGRNLNLSPDLYNPGSSAVNLSGWKLTSLSGSISIMLTGMIQGNDYYLHKILLG